jgi:hypothetical protein
VSCLQAFENDRLARYAGGDLSEEERDAFEVHVLECADCRRALDALADAPVLLRDEGPVAAAPTSVARGARPALAWAAALVLGTVGGYLLRGPAATVPEPDPVFRSSPSGPVGQAVDAVVDAAAAPAITVVPRGVVLLTASATPPAVGERLEVALRDPAGQSPFTPLRVPATDGRVRVVVDTKQLAPGSWQMEIRRLAPGGAVLETVVLGLDLR